MVYTKHFNIHTTKHLTQAKDYVENADKTLVDNDNKSHLDNIFPYITNDDKTISKQLVSGHLVNDLMKASDEFIFTKKMAAISSGKDINFDPKTKKLILDTKDIEKRNGRGQAILGHHLIQSFSPEDNLTAEEIHEIGRKTMLEFTGGEYEFIIATHTDQEHIHNHIVVNSTNSVTGKAMDWKIVNTKNGKRLDQTKALFEKISDKHASKAGAKIIEKSPKNSHLKYTMWQTEKIFKSKIKQRLDFLLAHSSDLVDFQIKAESLNLHMDFSKKWATYRLLDQAQIKNTRSRSLSKKNPERYNLENIEAQLKENDAVFSVDDVIQLYQEKEETAKQDFDYQVTVEPWQIEHWTEKGFYLNVDFGAANRGQIFIGAFKVDRLDDGNFNLFIKKKDFFYFMNEKNSTRNRYMTGDTLVRQLSLYNGTIPLKKEPVMSRISELVNSINFLFEHDVSDGKQLENLRMELLKSLDESYEKIETKDESISKMLQAAKLKWQLEKDDIVLTDELEQEFKSLGVEPEKSYQDIQAAIKVARVERKILSDQFDEVTEELNHLQGIQTMADRLDKDDLKASL
ncbi:elongation factor GreAB [Bacilli bacterium]|nr:elongation factor GreAB [Bacilli bacterium]